MPNRFSGLCVLAIVAAMGCSRAPAAQQPAASERPSLAAVKVSPSTAPAEPAPAAAPAKPALNLGGGYQDIQWGTLRRAVLAKYGRKVRRIAKDYADANTVVVDLSDSSNARLEFGFFHDRLARVFYYPDSEADAPAILQTLLSRYGDGKVWDSQPDAVLGLPRRVLEWDDGESRVMVVKLLVPPNHVPHFSPGTHVQYRSIAIESEAERESQAIEAAAAAADSERRVRQVAPAL